MTRGRARIIAVQAIVVSALMVIVVLTILRPDDSEPLRGVNAPEGTEQVAGNGNGDAPADDRGEDEDGRNEPAGDSGTSGEGGGIESAAGADVAGGDALAGGPSPPTEPAKPPVAPGSPPLSDSTGGGSPTDDQYSDSVARLYAALYPEP